MGDQRRQTAPGPRGRCGDCGQERGPRLVGPPLPGDSDEQRREQGASDRKAEVGEFHDVECASAAERPGQALEKRQQTARPGRAWTHVGQASRKEDRRARRAAALVARSHGDSSRVPGGCASAAGEGTVRVAADDGRSIALGWPSRRSSLHQCLSRAEVLEASVRRHWLFSLRHGSCALCVDAPAVRQVSLRILRAGCLDAIRETTCKCHTSCPPRFATFSASRLHRLRASCVYPLPRRLQRRAH